MDVPAVSQRRAFEALWPERPPRVYVDEASLNATRILSDLPIDFVDESTDADLVWVRRHVEEWLDALAPGQAFNHIPNEPAIVHKANLARHLQRYAAQASAAPIDLGAFLQPTYCLSDPAAAAAFAAQLPARDTPENLWILKPSNLSKGRGVKVVWAFDWLRKALRKDGAITFRYEGRELEYLVQRYIKNVLLLDGRKSEIRIYWLVASLDPLLVLMYPEGTARLTLEPFKLEDFSNPLIHITNAYQQKKHGDTSGAELKWDFARLEDYVVGEKGAPANFLHERLRPRLRQILAYVVRASLASLREAPPDRHYFGLFGADFILDDAMNPWLTEIQKGPGLSHDDAIKQAVLPPMLTGAASLILELLALRREGRPLDALSSTYGYEWVIRERSA